MEDLKEFFNHQMVVLSCRVQSKLHGGGSLEDWEPRLGYVLRA